MTWVAGADGCKAGWIVAFAHPDGDDLRVRVIPRFGDIAAQPEQPVRIAVDMPIGLPGRYHFDATRVPARRTVPVP